MNIKSTLYQWDKCGLSSVDKFSLSNHYSILFEDDEEEGGGFDFIFKMLGLSRDEVIW